MREIAARPWPLQAAGPELGSGVFGLWSLLLQGPRGLEARNPRNLTLQLPSQSQQPDAAVLLGYVKVVVPQCRRSQEVQ